MKKILLIIFTVILILSVNVLAVDIDIGMPAINRGTTAPANYTWVNMGIPSNASGTITSVEIWAWGDLTNCEVAIFYVVSGNNLSTRDTEFIGSVTGGSKQVFEVDLEVQEGDYIGMFCTVGNMEKDGSGFDGLWYKNLDQIPCTNVLFGTYSGDAISLCGTGASIPVGWEHLWNTKEISKWNTKEFTKWNGLE